MSKLTNMLKMLIILNQEELVQTASFEGLFGISNKQVRRYREELIQAGFEIKSLTGKNGGYQLVGKDVLLNDIDIYDKSLALIGELSLSIKDAYTLLTSFISNEYMRSISLYDLTSKELYHLILLNESIKNPFKQVIRYGYINEYIEFQFQPYFVYKRFNTWYVVGYSDYANNVSTLEIEYILDIKQSSEKFTFPIADANLFKKRLEHLVGIYIPGKMYRVKCQSNILKQEDLERILETDVVYQDNHFYFDSYSLNDTKRKVMSLGSMVIVKAPIELVASIKQDLQELSKQYMMK